MIKAQVKELVLLRVSKGWNQAELAKNSGLAPSTITKIEQGSNVSAKSAKKIADALQVEVRDISLQWQKIIRNASNKQGGKNHD